MKKISLFSVMIIFAVLTTADPIFLFTDPKTHFSIELYNNQFRMSIFQPFVYTSVPVDWILPDKNKDLIKGVIKVESNFFIHALSPSGAMGLTQLMPSTAYELGVLNPFNVFWSADGATRYIDRLQNRFGKIEYALSAYYEGPTKVAQRGPSVAGLDYARKVLRESDKLKNERVSLKDVLYVEPYLQLGKDFSVGSNLYFSLFGIIDFAAGIDISLEQLSHFLLAYPNLSHSFSPIVGQRNLDLVLGFCYRKLPDFGVQFLLSSQYVDLSILMKIWQLYLTVGFSSKGLKIGVIK